MPYNQQIYAGRIQEALGPVDARDLAWLCNQAAKLYKRVEPQGCVDNFRVSKLNILGMPSDAYTRIRERGCCGSSDEKVKNPVTGNRFIIGFNYGH